MKSYPDEFFKSDGLNQIFKVWTPQPHIQKCRGRSTLEGDKTTKSAETFRKTPGRGSLENNCSQSYQIWHLLQGWVTAGESTRTGPTFEFSERWASPRRRTKRTMQMSARTFLVKWPMCGKRS